jgi:fructose-specific component phosphotransferase system IIB-like protein
MIVVGAVNPNPEALEGREVFHYKDISRTLRHAQRNASMPSFVQAQQDTQG